MIFLNFLIEYEFINFKNMNFLIVGSSCNVPTIAQSTVSPQQSQVSVGAQITITCLGANNINGGTVKSIMLYCVSGGFSRTLTGTPEILPVCNISIGEFIWS